MFTQTSKPMPHEHTLQHYGTAINLYIALLATGSLMLTRVTLVSLLLHSIYHKVCQTDLLNMHLVSSVLNMEVI